MVAILRVALRLRIDQYCTGFRTINLFRSEKFYSVSCGNLDVMLRNTFFRLLARPLTLQIK